jgi:hypothetical protein
MSPNALAILGIVAHYVTAEGELRGSVLALREVNRKHSKANQAIQVMEVLNDYDIAFKLKYFQMDNAFSNDVLLKELSIKLKTLH